MGKAKYGPNVTQLIVRFMSYAAIPKGGGLADGIEFIRNPERRKKVIATAEENAINAIWFVKNAPGNTDTDDESIAKIILEKLTEREKRLHPSKRVKPEAKDG